VDTADKIVLENGVRVLLDPIGHVRSVSLGIWVAAGSRLEGPGERGICHFIEHMLFKGTPQRSARQIAVEIDSVGGVINAFTSREYSSFYVKVVDEHLPMAVDLLTDIYLHSTFDPEELERERGVLLQEIRMVDDTPEEHVMDLFHKLFWKGSSMGYPIQGDTRNVSRIGREALLDRLGKHYHHTDVLVSVAGHFDAVQLMGLIGERMGKLRAPPRWPKRRKPSAHPGLQLVDKDLEQVHVCLAAPAPCAAHADRYAYYLLNTVLGGGMSSRLFQEVREKRGLAYSIYSFVSPYADTGCVGVYMGTTREELNEALSVILREMEDLAQRPVAEEELRSAREQIKGGLILGLESSDRLMGRRAKNELYFGRDVPVEEVIRDVEAVSADSVQRAAQEAFGLVGLTGVILGKASPSDVPDPLRALLS
jgi:predicted Zn-dependent peptidase